MPSKRSALRRRNLDWSLAPMRDSCRLGRIRNVQLAQSFALEGYTVLGRATHCGVLLSDHRVSNEHASLRWGDSGWSVRDLGSTNGTWVNGHAIPGGVDVPLRQGDELAFGDRSLVFEVEDDGMPQPMATSLSGAAPPCIIVDGVIAIPSSEKAVATIFRGADGAWMLESEDRVRRVLPGEAITVAGDEWRFACPVEWQATAKIRHVRMVQESTLYFDVSSDEEHVSVSAEHQGERVSLGQISAYYLLLTLARIQIQERGQHPAAECGWIHRDDLMAMLRCNEQQLNVWIHGIRSRFSSKDFLDYASVIERRDGTGQLRIGVESNVIQAAR